MADRADGAGYALAERQKLLQVSLSIVGPCRDETAAKIRQMGMRLGKRRGAQIKLRQRQAVVIGELGNAEGFHRARRIDQVPAHVVGHLADKGLGVDGVAEGVGRGAEALLFMNSVLRRAARSAREAAGRAFR